MQKRKAILFIDGNNWYHNLKYECIQFKEINFVKLANYVCSKFDVELKEIRYYNSMPDISDGEKEYYKHLEFLNKLQKEAIKVRTRKLKKNKKKNLKSEKGIDVLISVDMIRKTIIEKECDCCILISGDADFIPTMEILKKSGFEAMTCSVKTGYSSELKQGKFRYLDLKIKEIINNCLT